MRAAKISDVQRIVKVSPEFFLFLYHIEWIKDKSQWCLDKYGKNEFCWMYWIVYGGVKIFFRVAAIWVRCLVIWYFFRNYFPVCISTNTGWIVIWKQKTTTYNMNMIEDLNLRFPVLPIRICNKTNFKGHKKWPLISNKNIQQKRPNRLDNLKLNSN